jgi:hypothetical protein
MNSNKSLWDILPNDIQDYITDISDHIIEYNTSYYFTKHDIDVSELINYIKKQFNITEDLFLKIKYHIAIKRYFCYYTVFEICNKDGEILFKINELLKITTTFYDKKKYIYIYTT